MNNPGQIPYRLSFFPPAKARLKECIEDAIRLGIREDFAKSLRTIERSLINDPIGWGEPSRDFHAAKLRRFQKLYAKIMLVYLVHEEGRVVMVQEFNPVLGHPLQSSN